MGGERASTVRQREAGKICALCHTPLDASPWQQGERLCNKCGPQHRILMNFMDTVQGCRISFLEADCRTSLPYKLTFADSEKIREMSRRFGSRIAEDVQALEYALSIGRGGVWLTLGDSQYQVLMRGKKPVRPAGR